MTCVARIWRDEADGAVQVLAVIPNSEGFHPGLCIGPCGKALGRPFRTVFACSEKRLGERIVVADTWAAVGGRDPQFFHRHLHRGALHRATVVSVQN